MEAIKDICDGQTPRLVWFLGFVEIPEIDNMKSENVTNLYCK